MLEYWKGIRGEIWNLSHVLDTNPFICQDVIILLTGSNKNEKDLVIPA